MNNTKNNSLFSDLKFNFKKHMVIPKELLAKILTLKGHILVHFWKNTNRVLLFQPQNVTHLIQTDPDIERKQGLKQANHFEDTVEPMSSLCKNSTDYVCLFLFF